MCRSRTMTCVLHDMFICVTYFFLLKMTRHCMLCELIWLDYVINFFPILLFILIYFAIVSMY